MAICDAALLTRAFKGARFDVLRRASSRSPALRDAQTGEGICREGEAETSSPREVGSRAGIRRLCYCKSGFLVVIMTAP